MKGLVKAIVAKAKKSRAEVKAEEEAEAAKKAAARERIVKQLEAMGVDLKKHELLLADGFEDAFVGIVERFGPAVVACYDKQKCLEILEKQGLNPLDAVEYFEFNVIGAWMGDYTPYFLTLGRAAPTGAREQIRLASKADAAPAPVDAQPVTEPAEK